MELSEHLDHDYETLHDPCYPEHRQHEPSSQDSCLDQIYTGDDDIHILDDAISECTQAHFDVLSEVCEAGEEEGL